MKPSKPLICFDLDGTIVDNTSAHINAFTKTFKKNKLPAVSPTKIRENLGPGIEVILKKFFPRITEKQIEQCVKDHLHFLIVEGKFKAVPGVERALLKLKKKYRLAIVSNSRNEDIMDILESAKINMKIFDAIIGEDDVRKPKPAPNEIFKAERLLKANAEYMVGDTIYDIRAGKKAHCKTIAVRTGVHTLNQLWKEKPTIIVRSVADIPEVLL